MQGDYLGIEIGGTKLQLAVRASDGSITARRRLLVRRESGAQGIRAQIERAALELTEGGSPRAAGVGFGGPVDWRAGRVIRSHQIEGWSGWDLKTWLEGILHCPVHCDNDGNVAALGEAAAGAGRGFNPVFYATLGSGVGGGLIVDGKIYHGAVPGESEIGHMRLDRAGRIVESSCSGWAVDRKVRERAEAAPNGVLATLIREAGAGSGEARFLTAALRRADRAAEEILSETATDLGFALSHVIHLAHPEIVILGGGLSLLGEPLRLAVACALGEFVMEAFPAPTVALSALGEDAVPIGAAELARERTGEMGVGANERRDRR